MPDVSGSLSLTLYRKSTTHLFLLSVFFFLTASALRQWASLVAQTVKSLPAVLGDLGSIPGLGRSPGEMATYASVLTWEIPWMEGRSRLQFMGLQRVKYD